MKRAPVMEMGRCVICLGMLVLLASVTGCADKMKLLDARIDAVDQRLDVLSEDLETYDQESKDRYAGQEIALGKLENSLTSRLKEGLKALDAVGRKRSANQDAALGQLETRLTSKFDEQIKAVDKASQNRSAGNEAAILELEDSFTAKLAAQQQAFYQDSANVKKSLHALKTELDKVDERDANTQTALAAAASKADLERMIKDVRERYAKTQQVLDGITKSSAQSIQLSADTRTAMERLVEAHAILVKGGADLIAALEAGKTEGDAEGSESVYLTILYEQRKAQTRLLKELQVLLLQAAGDMQAKSEAKNAKN